LILEDLLVSLLAIVVTMLIIQIAKVVLATKQFRGEVQYEIQSSMP